MQELIKMAEDAIQKTSNWATVGWSTTFGTRGTEVNNLEAAKAMPTTFVYRDEAISYWERVAGVAPEVVVWGKKVVEALKAGNLKAADDAATFTMWIEKPIREIAPTWEPVVKAIRAAASKAA